MVEKPDLTTDEIVEGPALNDVIHGFARRGVIHEVDNSEIASARYVSPDILLHARVIDDACAADGERVASERNSVNAGSRIKHHPVQSEIGRQSDVGRLRDAKT